MMWEHKEGNSHLGLFADSKFQIHELPPHQNPKVVLEINVGVLFLKKIFIKWSSVEPL